MKIRKLKTEEIWLIIGSFMLIITIPLAFVFIARWLQGKDF